jgi:hypothetical protein
MIGNSKFTRYNLEDVLREIRRITTELNVYLWDSHVLEFEQQLLAKLQAFNKQVFSSAGV